MLLGLWAEVDWGSDGVRVCGSASIFFCRVWISCFEVTKAVGFEWFGVKIRLMHGI